MSHRITCPNCQYSMSLKAVKPGRFKPTCSSCGNIFVVQISEGDPVSIRVAKLPSAKDAAGPGDSGSPSPQPSAQQSVLQQTLVQETPTQPLQSKPASAKQSSSETEETLIQEHSELADTFTATAPGHAGHKMSQAGLKSKADTKFQKTRPKTQQSKRVTTSSGSTASSPAPQVLGGYRILSELGRGGMGAVYLAKQLSLARNVALKTIQAHWAENPRVITRFIREAYAAAQLTHHNVVQIYDLGEDNGVNFFSMELVRGKSLEDLVGEKGKLDVRMASNCILQAARGLKYAHDNGMIHRDVKPANLMFSEDGLVKVADLGLVKTSSILEDEAEDGDDRKILLASASAKVTGAGSTMGTPAYMSPEQADDAAQVDHRADIYSLGCTFFTLLTGKPPFTANSVVEVITQHKTQPVVRTGSLSADVSEDLAAILKKMTAKKADDRYQDLADVISDLERFLDRGKSNTSRIAEHSNAIHQASQTFHSVPAMKLRSLAPIVFAAGAALLTVIMFWISWKLMFSVIAAAVLTPVLTVLVCGIVNGGSPILDRIRGLIFGASWKDWIQWSFGALLVIAAAAIVDMAGFILLALFLSAGMGFVYLAVVDKPLRSQRQASVQTVESQLRELRFAGMAEPVLQQFLVEKCGRDWEELFATVFSYDDMRQVRKKLQKQKQLAGKNQFGSVRDLIADRLDLQIDSLKRRHECRMFEKLERKRLRAKGLSNADAKRQAAELAAMMVGTAAEIRRTMSEQSGDAGGRDAAARREKIRAMLSQARSGKGQPGRFRIAGGLSWLLPGAMFRFLLGATMLTLCALWARQNGLLSSENLRQIQEAATETVANVQQSGKTDLTKITQAVPGTEEAKPLALPVIGQFFNSFAPGVLAVLILMTAVVSGWRYSLFVIAATCVTLLAPVFVRLPAIGSVQSGNWVSLLIGIAILVVGYLFCRKRKSTA